MPAIDIFRIIRPLQVGKRLGQFAPYEARAPRSTALPRRMDLLLGGMTGHFFRYSLAANAKNAIKHVAEITIHAILPPLLSMALVVQKITSALE